MSQPNRVQEATLYFRQGSSDKVYHAQIEAYGGKFVVNYAYGRRGSTLTTGTKTQRPVELADAQKIYDKLISEKTGKGYIVGENVGTSYVPPANTPGSEIVPQLLSPVEDPDATRMIVLDSAYCAQEKFDGKRIMLVCERSGITAYNRSGKACGIDQNIVEEAKRRMVEVPPAILDGEAIGDTYYAFDLLSLDGEDRRNCPLTERLLMLKMWVPLIDPTKNAIARAATAVTKTLKAELCETLWSKGAEGVVLKKLSSPYLPGRQNDQFKAKFWSTASCLVIGMNDKNSVQVAVFNDEDKQVNIGNVTIRNPLRPKEGDILEVRYLNFLPNGSLYQPTMLSIRDDITVDACTLDQLHLKGQPRFKS